jgi:hypothetical protein
VDYLRPRDAVDVNGWSGLDCPGGVQQKAPIMHSEKNAASDSRDGDRLAP